MAFLTKDRKILLPYLVTILCIGYIAICVFVFSGYEKSILHAIGSAFFALIGINDFFLRRSTGVSIVKLVNGIWWLLTTMTTGSGKSLKIYREIIENTFDEKVMVPLRMTEEAALRGTSNYEECWMKVIDHSKLKNSTNMILDVTGLLFAIFCQVILFSLRGLC